MKKTIRLTESELHELITRIVESSLENETEHEYEEVPNIFDDEISFDDDYGLENHDEDDFEIEPEDFDKEMKTKSFMKKHRPSSTGLHGGRWEHQEPYNPIKPSDMPLEKYLAFRKSKSVK